MGFRQEIVEEQERKEQEKKDRAFKLRSVQEYCSNKNIPQPSDEECDRILHPEDYDDWGHRKHFTS